MTGGVDLTKGTGAGRPNNMLGGIRGFTLIEMTVALAVAGMLMTGVAVAITRFTDPPRQSAGEVALQDELRSAIALVREDAAQAMSFESKPSPQYGSFRWLDFSTFPATRYQSDYYYEENILYRQLSIEGVANPPHSLTRNIAADGDATFLVSSSVNPSAPSVTDRVLTITIKATTEGNDEDDPIIKTASIDIALRPGQIDPIDFQYYFLHNSPSPPVAGTTSQTDLPLDLTEPTATTLYNYDTNRDLVDGLRLVRSSQAAETDNTKHQDWVSAPLASSLTIDGRITLFVAAAADALLVGQDLQVIVSVWDRAPGGGTTQIGNQPVVWLESQAGWTQVALRTDEVQYTVPAGNMLQVTLQFDEKSQSDGILAYDTTTHLAFLMVPTQP